MNNEEYFDVVDTYGNPLGSTVSRSEAHTKGIRHRTAHIWVVNKDNNKYKLLLQKRSSNKDSFPGCFDTSSAGHIQAGDEPLESAIRELHEELGITATKSDLTYVDSFDINYSKEFRGKLFVDNEIAFIYVYEKKVDITKLTLQEEEVECVEWFDIDYLNEVLFPIRDHRFCVPNESFKIIEKWCKSKN